MKKLKTALVLLLMVALLVVFPITANAASVSEKVYANDFVSGEIDDSFIVNYGTLSVVKENDESFLRCSHQNNRIQFAYGPSEQRNVDISFRVRATNLSNASNSTVSPFFRSPHIPAWDTISYQLQFKTYETAIIYADRFADDATLEPIASYPDFGISVGLWNNVQISTRGERIIVYVNGDRILETVDNRYGEYGGFGFTGLYSSFDIDDIVITRYYGNILPEPVENERPLWMGDISENEEKDIPDTGIIRIDLTNLGQNKQPVDNSVIYIDPTQITLYTWVALVLAVMAAGLSIAGFVTIKISKGGKT